MGKIKSKLTEYKNFWLIWLSCAGSDTGISLFKIQTTWDIQTNYLYHKEAGLGKPLFSLMNEEGYIEITGNKISPRFEWITKHILDLFIKEKPEGGFWSPELLVKRNWPKVQLLKRG